jgi:L-rhamnose mutarotase
MPKVLFTVSYQVKPEMRETYLSHVKRLRDHLQQEGGRNYTVFRSKGKDHLFSEVLVANSMEEFDTMEDNQDELTQKLLNDIEGCMEKGTTRYATMIELE